MNAKTYNYVHTYVEGKTFPNIFGGHSPTQYGYITHIEFQSAADSQRWPYLKNKWVLSTAQGMIGYYKTLREAKAESTARWPGCFFKTPAQYRNESKLEGF